MLIIEGCDSTGKSTLGHKLAQEFNYQYTKENKPLYDGFQYYVDRSLNKDLQDVVMDRFHLGEFVYPQIKIQENRKPLNFTQLHLIERILLSKGAVLILADTSKDFILNGFRNRGEDYVFENEIDQIQNLFREAYDKSILPKIKYDVEDPDSYRKVSDFCKKHNFTLKLFRESESCGDWQKADNIMLVGEKYGDGSYVGEKTGRAFGSTNNSSYYLHQALELTGQPEKYYITNAHKYSDINLNISMISQEYEVLKPSKVIALGKSASNLLTEANIKHVVTYHPQWWKRFKHHDIEGYAKKLI